MPVADLDDVIQRLNIALLADDASPSDPIPATDDWRRTRHTFTLEELLAPDSNTGFVENVFLCLLHREVDAGALAWYSASLTSGEKGKRTVVEELLASDEGKAASCAVIGVTPTEHLIGALIKDSASYSSRIAQLEAEMAAVRKRVTAIPAAQTVFLKVVFDMLRADKQNSNKL